MQRKETETEHKCETCKHNKKDQVWDNPCGLCRLCNDARGDEWEPIPDPPQSGEMRVHLTNDDDTPGWWLSYES